MNNIKTRNKLFTLLLLVMALLIPQWGWAQTAIQPEKGDGGANNPYIIRTAENLAWFRDQVNSGKTTICAKIADDVKVIDMKTVCAKTKNLSWRPIGVFEWKPYQGTFDGNGKTIKNLYIKASQDVLGFFGYTEQSTIKNLIFEDADVTNTPTSFGGIKIPGKNTGFLVGTAKSGSTLQDIKISSTCRMSGGSMTGGIAGSLDGNAYNCVNYAAVKGYSDVGGLFGKYSGNSMTACANYGIVAATNGGAGGLLGDLSNGTIQDCANYGEVGGTKTVGGIAGSANSAKIQNVFCYGNIKGRAQIQPKVGMVFGSSNNVTTEGMVAYYSGATVIENIQVDVKAFGGDNLSEDKATGFTEAQLKSGEVAFKLQQNASTEAKWGQKLANGGDIYPVIGSKYRVYETVNCKTNKVVTGSFTNGKYQHGKIDHHAATAASCTEAGTKEYWQCQDCQRTYSDEQLTEELTDVTAPALGHINNADGYCSRCKQYVAVKPSQKNGVYLIAEPYHLAWFRDYVNGTIVNDGEAAGTAHPSAPAMLTADIDLKNYCHAADKTQSLNELSWEPIGNANNRYHQGTFDGNGKTIKNLYINASQRFRGLFGYASQCIIRNLTLEHANVTNTSYSYTGILVGKAEDGSTLQNVKISDGCQVNGDTYIGGIAGELDGNAYNCVNYAKEVHGQDAVGGLFGSYYRESITACANYGIVTSENRAGGLVGYFDSGTIQDCANYGYVEGKGNVGGMAGAVGQGKIKNVFCYGSIKNPLFESGIGMAFGYSGSGSTEGMVAYYSGAKLTGGNEEQTAKAFGSGNLSEDKATAFTEAQLKSGEVAWLLNGSTSVPAAGKTSICTVEMTIRPS